MGTQPSCDGVLYNAPVPAPARAGRGEVAPPAPAPTPAEMLCCEKATHVLTNNNGAVCCPKEQVDACGVCNGNGIAIAPDGTCCSGPVDSEGKCCNGGQVNACGVCNGRVGAIVDSARKCCVDAVQDKN